jgi:predicted dehydrogenase
MRPRRPGAQERLNVGVIGVGGRGALNLASAYRAGENIVALCDVDEAALLEGRERVAERCAGVRLYRDFRVMFETEKRLDAVFISTPDHMHGIQADWALARGCPVYLESPLVRTLGELRALQARAQASGALVQLGHQGSAADEFRRAVEAVGSGVIGQVSEAHVWTTRPVWQQGMARPGGSDPVPDTLDWDLWLGVAPARPYKSKVYHRFNWRAWHDFGTGALGDGGPHLLNLPFRALALGPAATAEAEESAERSPETYSKASRVKFTFAARGRRPAVTLLWYDGGLKPPAELMPQVADARGSVPGAGCLLVGDKGVWFSADESGKHHALALAGEARAVDAERHEACAGVPVTLPRVKGQQQEFLDAVRSGERTYSDLRHVAPLAESILVGCAAQRVAGPLEWNSRKGRFAKRDDANGLAAPLFREGWAYLK